MAAEMTHFTGLLGWHKGIRAQFPILSQHPELAYLDSAATAQKPKAVLDAVYNYLTTSNANAGRGTYQWANRTTELIEAAARRVKEFLRDSEPASSSVHFVSGTSAGLRAVAQDWLGPQLADGDEIVVPYADHQANLLPWLELRGSLARAGIRLTIHEMPRTSTGTYDLSRLSALINKRTRLVAVTAVHHVYGAALPITPIRQILGPTAAICVDAAQSIGHQVISPDALGADFVVFSGHKAMALPGTGAVWARNLRGPRFVPAGWAGTPNTAGIVSLHAALDWLEEAGLARIEQWTGGLSALLTSTLGELAPVSVLGSPVHGPTELQRHGIVAFRYHGISAADLGFVLDAHGIMVRADAHCQGSRGDTESSVRASMHAYSSIDEVHRLVNVIASLSDQ